MIIRVRPIPSARSRERARVSAQFQRCLEHAESDLLSIAGVVRDFLLALAAGRAAHQTHSPLLSKESHRSQKLRAF